jgi:predicted DNA-binding transcriptional regulator YafY
MMRDKKIFNFLRFLKELKEGEVCLNDFAKKYNINVRTVQRYKNEVEEFFNIKLISTRRGCYTFPAHNRIDNFLLQKEDLNDFNNLANILSLINPQFLRFLKIDEKVIKKYIKDNTILVKESPIEELSSSEIEILKKAIKRKDYVDIKYILDKEHFFENVKPLKIVFAEGNWYLACLTKDKINNGFKFLRINWIKEIKLKNKEFKVPKEAKEFLKNFQTLFSSYKVPYKEVIVEVDEEVARHFRVKKFLPSQKILEDNGKLKISYIINNDNEIIRLVKRWIPHMKIITPIELQQKFKQLLLEFLEKN